MNSAVNQTLIAKSYIIKGNKTYVGVILPSPMILQRVKYLSFHSDNTSTVLESVYATIFFVSLRQGRGGIVLQNEVEDDYSKKRD